MNTRCIAAALLALLVSTGGQAAQKLELTRDDTVVVRADEAWEEPGQRIAHFRGNFQLKAPDWSVAADRAVVYGPLENPDRVVVDGMPARIRLLKSDRITEVEGQGRHIEYRRASDTVSLSGEARLNDGDNALVSSRIEYDIGADSISAGGEEGVEVVVQPKKKD